MNNRNIKYLFLGLVLVAPIVCANTLRVQSHTNAPILNLDEFADEASSGSSRSFDELKSEINQLFFSVPTILRLVAINGSLDAQVDQAEAAKDWQIELSVDGGGRTGSVGADGDRNSQSITATKIAHDFGATDSAIDQVKFANDSSAAEIDSLRSEALLSMVISKIEVATQSRLVKLASSFYDGRARFQKFLEEKKAFGAASSADVVRASAKTYEAEAAVPTAFMGLQDALDRYQELYGSQPSSEDWYDTPAFSLDKKVIDRVEDHPLVRQAENDLASVIAELDAFRAGDYGTVLFQVSASRVGGKGSGGTGDSFDAKIVYQQSLADGGSRDASEAILKAKVAEYEAEFERSKRERVRVVRSAWNAFLASEGTLRSQEKVMTASRKANEATTELYLNNRGSIADVFKAEEDYVSAIRTYIDAKRSVQTNFYQLLHEAGVLMTQFELGI